MNQFRKLDENDQQLPDDAPEWAAVLQANTNLVWSKDDVSEDTLTAQQADEACAALRLCRHKDWRLPAVGELFSLADRTHSAPAINTAFFPSCKPTWYWAATKSAWPVCGRWLVSFNIGLSRDYDENNRARVRAVRSWSEPLAGRSAACA